MTATGWFFRVRVTILSCVLAAVCLWACQDVRARRARNDWEAPVRVGLVMLRHGNVDERALRELRVRSGALEARLAREFERYRGATSAPMIQIVTYGPVAVDAAPPTEVGDSFWARAAQAYRLWRYTSRVDAAAGVPTHELDSRIYVVAEAPQESSHSVEGFSEERGRVGVARVDLALDTVDLALFVAAHEMFHTLGATDKYEASGRTSIPYGLPEPDRTPLFPQPSAEVMARNRVIAPGWEIPPDTLDQLSVGRWTAQEIGWAH
ncbi:MAG: hypothetical protein QM756_15340 [Polyangiaceae bacterium]